MFAYLKGLSKIGRMAFSFLKDNSCEIQAFAEKLMMSQ